MHFGSITGREPRGDRAPTRIFPDEIASRPQLTAPSVFGISPASAQDPKDTNRLKKKTHVKSVGKSRAACSTRITLMLFPATV